MVKAFLVRKRTAEDGVTIHDVDDGLEAACKAFPELNLEVIDAKDDTTYVVDIDNDVMYVVKQIAPTA
ncbi:hypothetical protein G3A43_07290 [Paraburkholderia aspalathi]|nr:hypothetical protein [Paraburkholderia aspalathi]MBK3780057.1 hypothetical protein [Paraburkholderia aspalathi]